MLTIGIGMWLKKPTHFFLVEFMLICSWNQPVLCNMGEVCCSRKQQELLMGFKLTPDLHPYITGHAH